MVVISCCIVLGRMKEIIGVTILREWGLIRGGVIQLDGILGVRMVGISFLRFQTAVVCLLDMKNSAIYI